MTAPLIRDGFVAVRDGRVTGVGASVDRATSEDETEIDLGRAIVMPGFVNAHTHLELSNLRDAVPAERGFVPWIEDQLRVRAERPAAEVPAAIRTAIEALRATGTAAVADVSNSLAAVSLLAESPLHALVLHEVLGFDPARAGSVLDQTKATRAAAHEALEAFGPEVTRRVRIEVAAHAPHSLSRELFQRLLSDGGVRSIHVAESRSEDDFLESGSGDWRGFLDRRVGPVPFEAPGTSPVRYLDDLGVLTPGLLAVHCVRVDEDDATRLASRGAVAVLCPRSNEFLGNGVPPLAMLLGRGVSLALGSDSLASAASLNVLEDARLLARLFPRVPKAVLLHALTRGGALALGFDDLGEIRVGARASFAAVSFEGAPPRDPSAFVLGESAASWAVA